MIDVIVISNIVSLQLSRSVYNSTSFNYVMLFFAYALLVWSNGYHMILAEITLIFSIYGVCWRYILFWCVIVCYEHPVEMFHYGEF